MKVHIPSPMDHLGMNHLRHTKFMSQTFPTKEQRFSQMKPQNIYFDGIFLLSSNSASLYSKPNIANAYVVNRHVNWKTKQYLLGKMMKFMLIWRYSSKTCWWVSTAFTKKYWHIWWWFSSDFCFSFIFCSKKVVNFRIFVVTYLGGMEGVEVEVLGMVHTSVSDKNNCQVCSSPGALGRVEHRLLVGWFSMREWCYLWENHPQQKP